MRHPCRGVACPRPHSLPASSRRDGTSPSPITRPRSLPISSRRVGQDRRCRRRYPVRALYPGGAPSRDWTSLPRKSPDPDRPGVGATHVVDDANCEFSRSRRPEMGLAGLGARHQAVVDEPEHPANVGVHNGGERHIAFRGTRFGGMVDKGALGRTNARGQSGTRGLVKAAFRRPRRWSTNGDAGTAEHGLQVRRPERVHDPLRVGAARATS